MDPLRRRKPTVSALVWVGLLWVSFVLGTTGGIAVLPLRVDNPWPAHTMGSPLMVQLQADPADLDATSLSAFEIVKLDLPATQSLRLWDSSAAKCNGPPLSSGAHVPPHGKVCLWSGPQTAFEFESAFAYAAVDDSTNVGSPQTVTVVTYNAQACPSIPDFGPSGFVMPPVSPSITIQLDSMQIKFEVTVTYVRNQTTWLIDFFDFDGRPGGDSASGRGRTCSNHDQYAFAGLPFDQWWNSQPRANFDHTVHPSIVDALNDHDFPMYSTTNTRWSLTNVGCDKVKFTATIPIFDLISDFGGGCKTVLFKAGASAPAARANFTADLYVIALRPRDLGNEHAGYYKATFVRPFTFSLPQESISLLVGRRSSKLAHRVQNRRQARSTSLYVTVVDMRVSPGANLSLQLETTITNPGFNSPNVAAANFSLAAYPNSAARLAAAEPPELTRLGDNGKCANGSTDPCVIVWQVLLPELTLDQTGSLSGYTQQFMGEYSFAWVTSDNDLLASNLTIYAVAATTTDLGQLNVTSAVNFFPSVTSMTNASSTGMVEPTYSSGDKIWVRHSFLTDPADVSAYRFTLQHAWVCWSPVANFVPSLSDSGTGCSQDIPGVMEASSGQRFLLYNVSVGGIADVTVGSEERIWGWTQVGPTDSNWTGGQTVHNGFGINALALLQDSSQIRTYYFHLVSAVSQAPLSSKRWRIPQQEDPEESETLQRAATHSLGGVRLVVPHQPARPKASPTPEGIATSAGSSSSRISSAWSMFRPVTSVIASVLRRTYLSCFFWSQLD